MNDEYTARMAGFKPMKDIREASSFIKYWRGWAITKRNSDKIIGIIQVPICYDWEVGEKAYISYILDKEHRGRGYMTEAVQTIKKYLFKNTWINEIEIQVFEGNDASRNVAIKCGFFLNYEKYEPIVNTTYGSVESEESFTISREDYDWEERGEASYSTAA